MDPENEDDGEFETVTVADKPADAADVGAALDDLEDQMRGDDGASHFEGTNTQSVARLGASGRGRPSRARIAHGRGRGTPRGGNRAGELPRAQEQRDEEDGGGGDGAATKLQVGSGVPSER